jgi:preprotein translocase subunit YajC
MLAASSIQPLQAQQVDTGAMDSSVREGTRVRVTAMHYSLEGATGTVREVTDEGLLVELGKGMGFVTLPYDRIGTLEVSVHQESRAMMGGLLGGLAGAAAGAAFGLWAGDDNPEASRFQTGDPVRTQPPRTREEKAKLYGAAVGIAGSIIGSAFGAMAKKDYWVSATGIPQNVFVEPTVVPGGGGFSVRVSF